ncbi:MULTISPECIES: putative bacteriocin export ABC transporter [Lactococcus]|jgi:putative ABC transport system ATP-binding protein|uniref:putative bacteriocin export ABC transporter n=1 Tax=Lactococcus TaxID=1357 RepID=UPI000621E207|nr:MULTISPECIES: putative bacteriocin export ABC transporter [Lactococcus]KKF91708.1 bacteriocin ABC transporter ATP-binding protein [Lactococcus garvieae]KXT60827.1 ABC transporter ATP-binding protein [Lactococcus sp. DD01]MDC0826440.1 putative bacteriocin export ABC transporter [Lactococcus petauri]MDG6136415.1 putative bacteriocin export ABC transporter [Lactococcus petauri]MDT2552031.1 putative bacteriocin export ABC transporter [Lactococcus petauri]
MIELQEVSKTFGKHQIFDKYSLNISAQKMTAILGKSGAGKSTLLNLIGLIEESDSGKIRIAGQKAPKINSKEALLMRRNLIAFLFQNFALIEDESIERNLNISLVYEKLHGKEKRRRMREILNQVGITHKLSEKVYALSGGEKQRVALARALLKRSKIILADEPTGSLDEQNRALILGLLRQEVEKGKTVIVVTHDPAVVAACDEFVEI